MTCKMHFSGGALVLAALSLVACSKRDEPSDKRAPGQASATASDERAPAAPRAVRVAPELVDAGRIRTAPVARREPTGAIRLPAEVVANEPEP